MYDPTHNHTPAFLCSWTKPTEWISLISGGNIYVNFIRLWRHLSTTLNDSHLDNNNNNNSNSNTNNKDC